MSFRVVATGKRSPIVCEWCRERWGEDRSMWEWEIVNLDRPVDGSYSAVQISVHNDEYHYDFFEFYESL